MMKLASVLCCAWMLMVCSCGQEKSEANTLLKDFHLHVDNSQLREVRAYIYEDYPRVSFACRITLKDVLPISMISGSWSPLAGKRTLGSYEELDWWDAIDLQKYFANKDIPDATLAARDNVLYVTLSCKQDTFPKPTYNLMQKHRKDRPPVPSQSERFELRYTK